MSRVDIENFRRHVRQLLDNYKEQHLPQIEKDYAFKHSLPLDQVRGKGRSLALEAHVRAYLLNPLLQKLGWDVSSTRTMVMEDPVDPDDTGASRGNRRFLDYHGREIADEQSGRSFLIVEAKRPSVKLPSPDGNDAADLSHCIAEALSRMHKGPEGKADIPASWQEILETLKDYIRRTREAFGQAPARAAITNGEWFVIFTAVEKTLLSSTPSHSNISVFRDLEEVAKQAEEFFPLLAYTALSNHIPPQHPSALADFVARGEEVQCVLGTEVSYNRHGANQPLISVQVTAWVQTSKQSWIRFCKDYPEPFLILHHDSEDLERMRSAL